MAISTSVTATFRYRHALAKRAALGSIVVLALGCRDRDPPSQAIETKSPVETKAEAPKKSAPWTPPSLASLAADPLAGGSNLGHLVIPAPQRFLSDVREYLTPNQFAGMVDEKFLRAMVGGQLDDRAKVAENFDLEQAIACSAAPGADSGFQVTCAFGYRGGSGQLIEDLGTEGRNPKPAGHEAHYNLDNDDLFIDHLDESVVISSHTNAFTNAKPYLSQQLARAKKATADLEVVVYPSVIMKKYRSVIEPLFASASQGEVQTTGKPRIDAMLKVWRDYNVRSSRSTLDKMEQITQATGTVAIGASGVVLGYAIFPQVGSNAAKDMAAARGLAISPSHIASHPDHAWLVASAATNRDYATNSQQSRELRQMIAEAHHELSGASAKQTNKRIADFTAELAETYDEQVTASIGFIPGTLGGVSLSQFTKEGRNARDGWQRWTTRFTPAAVLGNDLAELVTWSFTANVADVMGIPVDRWTITPTEKGETELREAIPNVAVVEGHLGGLKLVVDRVEFDGRVCFVFAPKAEAQYVKAAIDAARGQGSLANDESLQKVVEQRKTSHSLLATNFRQMMPWLRELVGEKQRPSIPSDLGADFFDVVFHQSQPSDSHAMGAFVISQKLIDGLRSLKPPNATPSADPK